LAGVVGNLRSIASQLAGGVPSEWSHSADNTSDRESDGPSPEEAELVRVAGRLRVLIVEDELIIAWQLGEIMRELGHEVCGMASDGETAQRLAAELAPDLILMDVRLRAGRDGIETAAAIRAERTVPFVFCTAYADDPGTRRRLESVADAVVSKPIRAETLQAALTRALSRSD
jgi:CheY-like chemotaxis protein